MRVEQRNIYKFTELTETAKNKAIEDWRNSETLEFIGFEYDEYYRDLLAENGFNITAKEFRYSLSNSQGDGVSFLCTDFNKEILFKLFLNEYKYDREYKLLDLYDVNYSLNIKINDRYYVHEKSVYFDACLEVPNYLLDNYPLVYKKIENLLSDFTDFVENLRLDLCLKMEQCLKSEIEHQLSDEYISEILEINGYEFLENGEFYK